jgi:uncharacterized protein YjbJ (UPF0337 family)
LQVKLDLSRMRLPTRRFKLDVPQLWLFHLWDYSIRVMVKHAGPDYSFPQPNPTSTYEANMSSPIDKLNRKIDKIANTVKSEAGKVVGDITEMRKRAAAQAGEDMQEAGEQIKKAARRSRSSRTNNEPLTGGHRLLAIRRELFRPRREA